MKITFGDLSAALDTGPVEFRRVYDREGCTTHVRVILSDSSTLHSSHTIKSDDSTSRVESIKSALEQLLEGLQSSRSPEALPSMTNG